MKDNAKIVTKADLAAYFGISSDTLRKLLNVKYFEQLEPLGYEIKCRILPPAVTRKFISIYGKSIKDEDI